MSRQPTPTLSVRHYGAAPGGHVHDHFQVLWTLDGVLELEVDGHGLALPAGGGLVLSPGQRHDFESRQGSRCLVLDTLAAGWTKCPARPFRGDTTLALARYLACALQAGQRQALQAGPMLLLEAWGAHGPVHPRRRIDWAALGIWAQARWHQPLSVADLAAQVHLSATQFAARCREETGHSVMRWLRGQRLAQAHLWRAGGMSVAEAARRCGYRSPSALTAAMRRESAPYQAPPLRDG